MNKQIATPKAPGAIGPYSQAIEASGKTIYVSGQLPVDPATGEFAGADIAAQTRQSLTNVKNILEAAGYTMEDVAKTTVLLSDIANFGPMNEVYGTFFTGVSRLFPGCCSAQRGTGGNRGFCLQVMLREPKGAAAHVFLHVQQPLFHSPSNALFCSSRLMVSASPCWSLG